MQLSFGGQATHTSAVSLARTLGFTTTHSLARRQKMPNPECLFCRIAQGSILSHRVYKSESVVAFLDINPIRLGHIQVVPLEHFAYYDDLPSDIANEVMMVGHNVSHRLYEKCFQHQGLPSFLLVVTFLMRMRTSYP